MFIIDNLRDLYNISINKNNSKIEYLNIISQNITTNNFFIIT